MVELIKTTHKFQKPRKGMAEYNTVSHSLLRAEAEIDESWEALEDGDLEALKLEITDVLLFLAAALVALGVTEEEGAQLLKTKHSMNEERYDETHFERIGMMLAGQEYTIEDAVRRSRHYAKIGSQEPNDYY